MPSILSAASVVAMAWYGWILVVFGAVAVVIAVLFWAAGAGPGPSDRRRVGRRPTGRTR